jgi:glycine oxidase
MIIAGAGIIGLACAWRLAQKGIKVRIFDAVAVAREASWAGAGMLAPGGEIEHDSPLIRMALDSLRLYPDFVAELRDISGSVIDYQHCGAIEVALTEREAYALEDRASNQQRVGIKSERAIYKRSVSARFYPDDQLVAPRDLTNALRMACLHAGVSIHEHEPVTEVVPDGSGVSTTKGYYGDDGVLIAAGAWSSRLREGLAETKPVRGHLIAYRPGDLPADLLIGSILRHGHTYLLQRGDRELIAGSSTEHVGFDRAVDERIVSEIRSRAAALLPELTGLVPAERWNGFRPGMDNGIPAVGRIAGTAIWTAYGHYRNGILLAPETARIIAESAP